MFGVAAPASSQLFAQLGIQVQPLGSLVHVLELQSEQLPLDPQGGVASVQVVDHDVIQRGPTTLSVDLELNNK